MTCSTINLGGGAVAIVCSRGGRKKPRVAAPATIPCPYCGGCAPQATGLDLYPHREDLHTKRFYWCRPCDAYCGTHPDGQPLGRLADKQLRNARQYVHAIFDPLWQGAAEIYGGWNSKIKNTARIRAYEWLADRLGIHRDQCHVALFDVEQCRAAYRIIKNEQPTPASIRAWAKARRE